jgi:MATE family multidrug resistance protein
MIWFSLATFVLYIPIGIYGGDWVFSRSRLYVLEEEYFRWLMYFGPTFALGGALAAFYVGRGKTMIVTSLALVANVVNVFLDWIFIFGIEGWIPSMGVKGAAIATCLGNIVQIIVLLILFLNKHHREVYGTGRCRFIPNEMRKCIRVGLPQGLLFFVESVGWAIFYMMITDMGAEHIFVAGVVQTIVMLLFFFAEGIGRGAAAIAGNFIGAKNISCVYRLFGSGLKLHLCFFVVATLCLVIYPQPLMNLFLGKGWTWLGIGATNLEFIENEMVSYYLKICMQMNVFFLLFEGVRWLISGILTAAGDTFFLLINGTISVLLFLLAPTYLLVWYDGGSVISATAITIGYSFLVGTIFIWRFFRAKWTRIDLIA